MSGVLKGNNIVFNNITSSRYGIYALSDPTKYNNIVNNTITDCFVEIGNIGIIEGDLLFNWSNVDMGIVLALSIPGLVLVLIAIIVFKKERDEEKEWDKEKHSKKDTGITTYFRERVERVPTIIFIIGYTLYSLSLIFLYFDFSITLFTLTIGIILIGIGAFVQWDVPWRGKRFAILHSLVSVVCIVIMLLSAVLLQLVYPHLLLLAVITFLSFVLYIFFSIPLLRKLWSLAIEDKILRGTFEIILSRFLLVIGLSMVSPIYFFSIISLYNYNRLFAGASVVQLVPIAGLILSYFSVVVTYLNGEKRYIRERQK